MEERFDRKDLTQIIVGAFVGALSFLLSGNVAEIGARIPLINSMFVVIVSIFFSYVSSYHIGVRKLGRKRMRKVFIFPLRVVVHYSVALLVSVFVLYLLGVNDAATELEVVVKRILVLALPATVMSSAIDLVESQK
jgi:uncharacterized membrane protein